MQQEMTKSNISTSTDVETFEKSQSNVDHNDLNPFLIAGIGTFFILNVGVLLSLPPVLMGRGMCDR
jgi:hypothetical protein